MNWWRIVRLCALVAALAVTAGIFTQVSAAPAAPVEFQLSQPDGTVFSARQWGDEWQNGFETDTGYTILKGDDGWWTYAALEPGGELNPALQENGDRLLVGVYSPEGLPQHIRPETSPSLIDLRGSGMGLAQNTGTQPVLVLLASFSNRNGTVPPVNFANSFFGATNSVKDFYLDASFNQLILAPAAETYHDEIGGLDNDGVIGWINLEYPHPNTGSAIGNANQLIVKNALIRSDPYINYATYDTNGDGKIGLNELHIVVIVAGYEQSYDTSSPSVWAHRWNLNDVGTITLDGKILGDYQYGGYSQFGEIHGDHQATIGVMAHELGHDIDWPDLYDVDQSSEGVGRWSLMGSGSWNYASWPPGSSPAMPDAWLKWYQGWITPAPVNGTVIGAAIGQSATNPTAYLLGVNPNGVDWDFYNHPGIGEYFLVENRNNSGYDAGLPGCGLLITHIDESVISTNDANKNENHPLVKIIEADGLNELAIGLDRGDPGDPFPGSSNNQLFGFNTTPNSRLYNGTDSQVEVNTISGCGTTVTANLRYGSSVVLDKSVFLPLINNGNPPPPNPIRNGTFEAGRDGNWIEYSSNNFPLIYQTGNYGFTPHGGSWAAWLGDVNSETSRLIQNNISLTGVRYLHYWYWRDSGDYCGYDYATIYVNGSERSRIDLCAAFNSTTWEHGMLDLSSFGSGPISLEFRVVNDYVLASDFFLDDVSITGSAAYSSMDDGSSSTPPEIRRK